MRLALPAVPSVATDAHDGQTPLQKKLGASSAPRAQGWPAVPSVATDTHDGQTPLNVK